MFGIHPDVLDAEDHKRRLAAQHHADNFYSRMIGGPFVVDEPIEETAADLWGVANDGLYVEEEMCRIVILAARAGHEEARAFLRKAANQWGIDRAEAGL
jgi:hypothetical protein